MTLGCKDIRIIWEKLKNSSLKAKVLQYKQFIPFPRVLFLPLILTVFPEIRLKYPVFP